MSYWTALGITAQQAIPIGGLSGGAVAAVWALATIAALMLAVFGPRQPAHAIASRVRECNPNLRPVARAVAYALGYPFAVLLVLAPFVGPVAVSSTLSPAPQAFVLLDLLTVLYVPIAAFLLLRLPRSDSAASTRAAGIILALGTLPMLAVWISTRLTLGRDAL
jgi:hypothetical protein